MNGKAAQRKKDEGKGIMISAIMDPEHGFGVPLTQEEAAKLNQAQHFNTLDDSKKTFEEQRWKEGDYLGLEFFDFGAQRDGYWDGEKALEQLKHVAKGYKILYPDRPLLVQLDHSSGHTKYAADALYMSKINSHFGGVQRHLRPSIMTEGCLGPFASIDGHYKKAQRWQHCNLPMLARR